MERNGTSTSAAISVMFCGLANQWLALGLKARGGPGHHCYLRGPTTCRASQHGETAWLNRSRGGVRCGHEVEEGPDRWTPPVCDSRARDPLASGKDDGRVLALSCWAGSAVGWASSWAAKVERREGGKKAGRAGRGEEFWAEPDSEGKRYISFFFLFKANFKIILKSV